MFTNLLKKAFFTCLLTLTVSTSVTANYVTHDILFDDATTTEVLFETIGSITVDTEQSDGLGVINSWVDFQLFGFDMITEAASNNDPSLFGQFEVFIDLTNISAGIEFLTFDVTESDSEFFNFQGLVDTATGDNFFIDVFDFSGGLYSFGDISLSTASVVSEPSMLLLFCSALVFFAAKRKRN